MQSIGFVPRTILSTGVFGALLGTIRMAVDGATEPVAGLVAVAVLAGVMLEFFHWRRSSPETRASRRTVQIVTGIAAVVWVAGLAVDLSSPNHGALVLGGSVAAAAVVYTYSLFPWFHII